MSEEILKALMQLFAIVSKQGDGGGEDHDAYVREFLLSQISIDRFDTYYDQYTGYKEKQSSGKGKLTSVKDSVRTLAICKRINKTLSQKQKSIVLVRISEFIYLSQDDDSALRLELAETISKVFKVDSSEYEKIISFSAANNLSDLAKTKDLRISLNPSEHEERYGIDHGLLESTNILFFCHIESAKIVLFRFFGNEMVMLNGLEIKPLKSHILTDGATVRTPKDSIFFNEVINHFREGKQTKTILFDAHIPTYTFKNGKKALHGVDIREEGGTLFGIMGGSGAGKTTLLNVLSGLSPSNEVTVTLNGHDVQSEESRANIGYIPQDDLLIEELTVYQNLYYNAKLINNTWDETIIEEKIQTVLEELGLWEIKDVKVGNSLNKLISGGQRKRLNIALELIREPLVLFVDEPTSGLSSKDSENVMDLLKLLSYSGKIVFVIIHQPASSIFKLFDKLMILDIGGLPVYYGNPIESVIYFKTVTNQINQEIGECSSCGNVNPEQIFDILENKEVDEFGRHTSTRKISAEKWNQFYIDKKPDNAEYISPALDSLEKISPPNKVKQFTTFFKRDLFSRLNDKQYILIALLEAPILGFVLSFIIRSSDKSETYQFGTNENVPAYIFMLVIVSLFVGLTISAEEIFKDRKILKREEFLRLSRLSYLTSKTSYLLILSAIQSFILVAVGNLILNIYDNFFAYWGIIFSVFVFGNLIGLILSSSFKTIITIYIIIPLIIIPQMILSGAMFKFENLNNAIGGGYHVPLISRGMIANWGYEGLMVAQFSENDYQKMYAEYEQLLSEYSYRTASLLPYLNDLLNEQVGNGMEESAICSDTVYQTLLYEVSRPAVKQVKEISLPENSSIEVARYIIEILDDFYQDKHNDVSRLKDLKIMEATAVEGKEILKSIKHASYNENVAEIVQNTLTTKRFFIDNSVVYQNYDHIYMRDHLSNEYKGSGNFMFVPYKSFLGITLSTFWFNFLMIWIFNFTLFIVLYFNLLKRLISIK